MASYYLLAPLVKETTTSTGTGTLTLAAVTNFNRFSDITWTGGTFYYFIRQTTQWEFGIGSISGSTLTRTTVIGSTNGDAAVNWGAGTKDVRNCVPPSGLLFSAANLSDLGDELEAVRNLGLRVASQTGGTNDKVVRLTTTANTWTDAANTDTADQLSALAFKSGGEYILPGQFVTGLSALTAGSTYYLSTAGAITATAPSPSASVRLVKIGKAYSTTALLFQPEWPAIDGTALNIPFASRVTADIGYTSTTLANVTGLTFTVAAGETRHFLARLYLNATGTGGYKASIAGTATATAVTYRGSIIAETATAFKATGKETTLGNPILAVASSVEDAYLEIEGTITVNAGGTLTVQFAQNTTNGTTTIRRGSTFVSQVAP